MSIGAILAVARFQLAGFTRRRGLWAWLALACMLASLALPRPMPAMSRYPLAPCGRSTRRKLSGWSSARWG